MHSDSWSVLIICILIHDQLNYLVQADRFHYLNSCTNLHNFKPHGTGCCILHRFNYPVQLNNLRCLKSQLISFCFVTNFTEYCTLIEQADSLFERTVCNAWILFMHWSFMISLVIKLAFWFINCSFQLDYFHYVNKITLSLAFFSLSNYYYYLEIRKTLKKFM